MSEPSMLLEPGAEDMALPPNAGGGGHSWRRPGWMISLAMHGLVAFFLLSHINAPSLMPVPFLPVELVRLAEETSAPAAPQKPVAPQEQRTASLAPQRQRSASLAPKPPQSAAAQPSIPNPPAPTAEEPPRRDELETQLEALSKLRQTPTDPRLLKGSGAADIDAGNGAGRGKAAYSVKDYIRAQVERRWNLDTTALGKANFVIPIHVVLAADGALTQAEIVDQKRYIADAAYRFIAVSALNAVRLSSPFALPAGHEGVMDVTLDLNPRDTLQ
ncbi:MAG TPA: hypothetical protein VHT51_11055 [Micropepsaceae bacterium]|jgi:hypothetical protein|nr:hypothetical protein [Micropepsaceae bacterium]